MISKHAELLNELDTMQHSPMYALRRTILARAEKLIAEQEEEIEKLKNQLKAKPVATTPAT